MKVELNLGENISSVSAQPKPLTHRVVKTSGTGVKYLQVSKAHRKEMADGVKLTSRAFKEMLRARKLRANLSAANARLAELKAAGKSTETQNSKIGKLKKDIAQTKRIITMLNSDAALALKVFGRSISIPYTTAILTSPAKSAKLDTYEGVKVDGIPGFVKTATFVQFDLPRVKTNAVMAPLSAKLGKPKAPKKK